MFNKIGFRTWKSGKLWLYMGVKINCSIK
ncbi:KxYKxGKxW signal peptide domain-containing protein [Streptococcus agalactiae]